MPPFGNAADLAFGGGVNAGLLGLMVAKFVVRIPEVDDVVFGAVAVAFNLDGCFPVPAFGVDVVLIGACFRFCKLGLGRACVAVLVRVCAVGFVRAVAVLRCICMGWR